MSLMRLLSAGKSLVGVKDNGSRYRMGNPGMLPRFGSEKNPFAQGRKENSESRGTRSQEDVVGSEKNHLPTQLSTDAPKKELSVKPAAPEGQTEKPIDNDVPQSTLQKRVRSSQLGNIALRATLTAWARIKAALSRRQGTSRRRTITRTSKQPVQAELSLDRIKVVRNDLSDTDFEVVAGGGARPSLAESNMEMAPKAKPASSPDAIRSRQFSGLRHEVENQPEAKGEMRERLKQRTVSPPFALADGIPPLGKATGRVQQAEHGNHTASLSAIGPGWFSAVNR